MTTYNLIEKAFALKQTSLFENLDLEMLLAIGDRMGIVSFNEGDKIFYLDQEDNNMYVIVEGEVEVRDHDQRIITTLSKGDFFGDESIFNGQTRCYEVISKGRTLLMMITRTTLLTVMSENPSIAITLLQEYASTTTFRKRKSPEMVQ